MQARSSQPAGSGRTSRVDLDAPRQSVADIRRQAREQVKEPRRQPTAAEPDTQPAATASASPQGSARWPVTEREYTPVIAAASRRTAEQADFTDEQLEDEGLLPAEGGTLESDEQQIHRAPSGRTFHPQHQGSAPVEGADLTPEEEEREVAQAEQTAGARRKAARSRHRQGHQAS